MFVTLLTVVILSGHICLAFQTAVFWNFVNNSFIFSFFVDCQRRYRNI